MKFLLFDVCVKCHNPLTKEEIDGSDGFCPKCGFDSDSLTCKTEKKKFVSLRPWWKFWQKAEYKPLSEIGVPLKPLSKSADLPKKPQTQDEKINASND